MAALSTLSSDIVGYVYTLYLSVDEETTVLVTVVRNCFVVAGLIQPESGLS